METSRHTDRLPNSQKRYCATEQVDSPAAETDVREEKHNQTPVTKTSQRQDDSVWQYREK